MTAHEIHALSGAYAVDALDDVERARFEAHLAVCAECQAEVASLQEATLLLTDLTEVAPSGAVRDNVLVGIKKVRPLPPVVARIERRRPRHWRNLIAAAAVLGAVAGGAYVVEQNGSDTGTHRQNISALDRVLQAADVEHRTTLLPGGASATVSWSPSERGAVLVTRKLAKVPAGRVYELWFQRNGVMVPAGCLQTGGNQSVLMNGDPGGATAVGVTVEPKCGGSAPTTAPVALVDLAGA